MKAKNCNCMQQCGGECPKEITCPLDSHSTSFEKDRSVARKRHHNSMKEKNRSFQNAEILSSRANKMPANAFHEECHRANQKADAAVKKCQRFKRQLEEQ